MADQGTAGECGLAAGGFGAGGEGQSGNVKRLQTVWGKQQVWSKC